MMKRRPSSNPQIDNKRVKASRALLSYEDIRDALDNVALSTDQLHHLSNKIDNLYSLGMNPIVQHFPTDLLTSILHTAKLHELQLPSLLAFRLVSKSWCKVICGFPRAEIPKSLFKKKTPTNYKKLFELFPKLRYLKVDHRSGSSPDYSLMTGLATLKIQEYPEKREPGPISLHSILPLTSLTKLSICSSLMNSIEPLTALPHLSCLSLTGGDCKNLQVQKLHHLTKLKVCDMNGRLFEKSKYCGFGILRHIQGFIEYRGDWKDGLEEGQGRQMDHFSHYVGQWKAGQKCGYGVSWIFDGDDEYGVEERTQMSAWKIDPLKSPCHRFEGQWEAGDLLEGVYHYVNGDRYEGPFKDNLRHGVGVLTSDGDRYEGEFCEDRAEGRGIFCWEDGSRYVGDWNHAAGGPHGQGVLYEVDGSRHEGSFEDGCPHGPGIYFAADGTRSQGKWQEGVKIMRKRGTKGPKKGRKYK